MDYPRLASPALTVRPLITGGGRHPTTGTPDVAAALDAIGGVLGVESFSADGPGTGHPAAPGLQLHLRFRVLCAG